MATKHETPEWATRLRDEATVWAHNVRDGIKRSKDLGFPKSTDLRNRVGAKETIWGGVAAGTNISDDPMLYLRLYALGVTEADPRTIPDRVMFNFREQQFTQIPRKSRLTDDQFQEALALLEQETGETAPPQAPQPQKQQVSQAPLIIPRVSQPIQVGLTLTGMDVLSAHALLTTLLGGGASVAPQRAKISDRDELIRMHAEELIKLLADHEDVRRQEWEAFARIHGDHLGRLLQLLAAVTKNAESWDQVVETLKDGGEA